MDRTDLDWDNMSEELRQHIEDCDAEERAESLENQADAYVYGDLYQSINIEREN